MSDTSLQQFSKFSPSEISALYETHELYIKSIQNTIKSGEKTIKMHTMVNELLDEGMLNRNSPDAISEERMSEMLKQLNTAIDEAKQKLESHLGIFNKLKELKELVNP